MELSEQDEFPNNAESWPMILIALNANIIRIVSSDDGAVVIGRVPDRGVEAAIITTGERLAALFDKMETVARMQDPKAWRVALPGPYASWRDQRFIFSSCGQGAPTDTYLRSLPDDRLLKAFVFKDKMAAAALHQEVERECLRLRDGS
jgi:hypothetical protein